MSDPFLSAALVGTSRMAEREPLTGTPVDDLVAGLGEMDRERALLLRAGAVGIYREAGLLPVRHAEPLPEPAQAETQSYCSPGAAALIPMLLSAQTDWQTFVLDELLQRLIQAGLCVPPEVLPTVFMARPVMVSRGQWRKVIGERGRWLAQFHSAWKWATEAPLVGEALPEDAETLWHEGAQSQRMEILTRLRQSEPERAREWIAAVWKQERAEMRGDMIQLLANNLSGEDEALLERALDDKVSRVREIAASVLAFLPESAFVQRMMVRADTLLAWQDGAWFIDRTPAFAADWRRDGLVEEPPSGSSKIDWYLKHILSFVPLTHWQMRAGGAAPLELITGADAMPYAQAIIEGWSRAAVIGGNATWLAALWDWWAQLGHQMRNSLALGQDLLARLPQVEAETRVQWAMRDASAPNHEHWSALVNGLPRPWSATFGHAYLAALREYIAGLDENTTTLDPNWAATFERAAQGLQPECFAAAQFDLPLPETALTSNNQWMLRRWEEQWRHFSEIITLRQRIIDEIPRQYERTKEDR